jgi:hypothetical protein
MKRVIVLLGLLVLSSGIFIGCGESSVTPPTSGPDGDSRTAEDKASEDLILKSQKANNKSARR